MQYVIITNFVYLLRDLIQRDHFKFKSHLKINVIPRSQITLKSQNIQIIDAL